MGSRGRAPKPPEEAAGHRKRTVVELLPPSGERPIPPAPSGLLASVRAKWDIYWRSEVGTVATEVDLFAVERFFLYYDEWERCIKQFRKTRYVEGSAGQIRLSPMAAHIMRLEGVMLRLQTVLGLDPMARARLGISIGQARLTVAELNRMASESPDDQDVEAETETVEGWEEA